MQNGVPRLHSITDEVLQSRFDHVTLARMALAGGAGVVQLREKRARSTRALVEIATKIAALDGADGRLIVDDRADVAAAVAAGVHVGDDDLPAPIARRIVGPDALVGVSASSVEEVRAIPAGVDYAGVGPVFGTRSKADAGEALGLERLAEIARACPVPVIAIGGITHDNARACLGAGSHGIAVLSAVVCAEDPRAAAAAFAAIVEEAR